MKQLLIILMISLSLAAGAQGKKKKKQVETPAYSEADTSWQVLSRTVEPISDTTYRDQYMRILYEDGGFVKVANAKITYETVQPGFERLIMILIDNKRLPIERLVKIVQ